MSAIETPPSRLGAGVLFVVLVFTLASVFAVNPYTYGTGDNSITIPFTQVVGGSGALPRRLPDDPAHLLLHLPLERARALHAHLGIDLEALFFGAYLIAVYFTFLGVYLIAPSRCSSAGRWRSSRCCSCCSPRRRSPASARSSSSSTPAGRRRRCCCSRSTTSCAAGRCFPRSLLGLAYLIHPLTAHYPIALILAVVAGRFRASRMEAAADRCSGVSGGREPGVRVGRRCTRRPSFICSRPIRWRWPRCAPGRPTTCFLSTGVGACGWTRR